MPYVPPWISGVDPIRAASAGASAGIAARGQDIGANEAADRLRFAYAQLAQSGQEQEAARAQQKEHADALLRLHSSDLAARLSVAAAQHAQQAGWHEEALKIGRASEALREKHET